MSEPKFLTIEQVLVIPQSQLQLFGGQDGIRDRSTLESAVAQPEAGFGDQYLHAYPFGMAAAYTFHIAENQPFVDGNKRTALDCALTFLEGNKIIIEDPEMELFQAMIDLGNHRQTKEGLALLFKSMAVAK
jgi:death-on-curing protein